MIENNSLFISNNLEEIRIYCSGLINKKNNLKKKIILKILSDNYILSEEDIIFIQKLNIIFLDSNNFNINNIIKNYAIQEIYLPYYCNKNKLIYESITNHSVRFYLFYNNFSFDNFFCLLKNKIKNKLTVKINKIEKESCFRIYNKNTAKININEYYYSISNK